MVDSRGRRWHVEVPRTRPERVHGLLRRDGIEPGHAMLFERTRSVHTVGMRFAITVAFLDASMRVIAARRMPPGRIAFRPLGTRHVLECGVDEDLCVGDTFGELGVGN
jgi:uncharacterized membrane protein (UPF0127 family)